MTQLRFDINGRLDLQASESSASSDFDFFYGVWHVRNLKLEKRLCGCQDWDEFMANDKCFSVLNGLGNINQYQAQIAGRRFEGLTVRLFDPLTRLWSLHWVDSNRGVLDVPQIGSFEGNLGNFYALDTF